LNFMITESNSKQKTGKRPGSRSCGLFLQDADLTESYTL